MPTTLRTLALAWRKAKEPLIKRSSLYAYQINIKNYLLPRWGKATAIAEAEVQQFILEAAEDGLAKNTIRNIVATLKAILKYGARNGLCEPPEWELHYPRWLDTPRIQTLSLSQHRKLLHYLVSTPSPHNIVLALCTGMRIGEVCALQWQDVDLHERILRVHQTYGYIYNCDTGCVEKQLSTPKTQHANREIPISRLACPITTPLDTPNGLCCRAFLSPHLSADLSLTFQAGTPTPCHPAYLFSHSKA